MPIHWFVELLPEFSSASEPPFRPEASPSLISALPSFYPPYPTSAAKAHYTSYYALKHGRQSQPYEPS